VSDDTPFGPPFEMLEDLLLHPELLAPPPVVLPRFAWAGRLTMVAAREKAGKSTLIGQAVAALAEDQLFLGEPIRPTTVLWLGLDEPKGDIVRRLADYGATGRVALMTEHRGNLLLEDAILELEAGLVVIDTLLEFASGNVEDTNSAMQWQPVLKSLRGILQRTNAAGILLHHGKKGPDGGYRDSTQIGAGVDAIIEMREVEEDPTLRKCRYRGRLRGEDFAVRFTDGRYELDAGTPTLEMRVLQVIAATPGASSKLLRDTVGGKAREVDAAVKDLLARGAITDRGDAVRHRFVIRPPGQGLGQATQIVAGQGGTSSGQGRDEGVVPPYVNMGGDYPSALAPSGPRLKLSETGPGLEVLPAEYWAGREESAA
jgi:hypothetical protein